MSTIIVSGGLGFIGTNLISFLLKKGHVIINLDKYSYSSNKFFLKNKKNYKLIKFDISKCDQKKLDTIFKRFNPDFLINLAAESHVDRSIEMPLMFASQNIFLTIKLLISSLKYQKKNKKFKFIHIGTDEVYGDLKLKTKIKFTETANIMPNNPYAASKASCNNFVRAFHKTFKLRSLIINPANNYGEFQSPEKFIPKSIISIIKNKPVEIYGNGKNMRNWTHVLDTVYGIETILKKGKVGETYNISSKDTYSNNYIISLLDKISISLLSKKIITKFISDRPGHDLKYSLDNKKLRRLGWKQNISFFNGLKKTFEWYLNYNNHKYFKNIKNLEKRVGKKIL